MRIRDPWISFLHRTATAWSALHFLKVEGIQVPFHPPPKLVATGP